jgi:uncharacterized protein (TIRG00374 family)
VGDSIGEANYLLVAVAAALLVTSIGLRALRWRLLFWPHTPGFRNLFGSLNVGYLINGVVPLQVGDLGRAYVLSELEGISTTRSLSTVIVERIFDVFTLLLLLLALAPFLDVPSWAAAPAALIAVITTAIAGAFVLAAVKREAMLALVEWGLRFAPAPARPKLRQVAATALEGFAVLTRPTTALALLAYSFAIWLSVVLLTYVGTHAFNLGVGVDAAVLLVVATSFGFFVPSSPGSFGVYHAIAIGTLTSVFDVSRHAAVSYALVIHLVFYLPPIVMGSAFLIRRRELWRGSSLFAKLRELRGQLSPAPAATEVDAMAEGGLGVD